MLYTIGHTKSYLQYFRDQKYPHPMKKGKTEDYEGGSIWETHGEAKQHCPDGYSVFGVLCTLQDTEQHPDGEPWRCLLKSSRLVMLDNEIYE